MTPNFPPRDGMSDPYWCPNCKAWYQPDPKVRSFYYPAECSHEREARVQFPPERNHA